MRTVHRGRRIAIVSIALATASCARQSSPVYQAPGAFAANAVWPGATWDSIRDPRTAGWTRSGLDSVRAVLSGKETTGLVAIVGGRKLMTYGNIDTVTYIASVRKSVGPRATGAFEGAYAGLGAFGQYIIVMPKLDLVVAHKTRPYLLDAQGNTRGVWASDLDQILDALVRTHCGASCP